jgi:serine/threonine protein kinase
MMLSIKLIYCSKINHKNSATISNIHLFSDNPVTSGQFLAKRYRIIEFIGSGAFGTTYLAVDTRLPGNPTCVVKQLLPTPKIGKNLKTAQRRFSREAKILEKLGKHPHIPQLFAYFEENQQFYLVEEYIAGYPLTSELTLGWKWSDLNTINLIQEILEILSFIHSNGVIHRDIKPSNIIRRQSDGQLFLIDFGAVKEINEGDASSQTRTMATGTPAYMPLEQFQGHPKPNSDIYAVGMIAIQALTGVHPRELPMIKNMDHFNSGYFYWKELVKISPEFIKIIDRMVVDDYHNRYQSTQEVLADLQKIQPRKSLNLLHNYGKIANHLVTDESTMQEFNLIFYPYRIKQGWIYSLFTKIKLNINLNSVACQPKRLKNYDSKNKKIVIFLFLLLFFFFLGLLFFGKNLLEMRAKKFYNQAVEKARNGHNEAAIADLNQAIKLLPNYEYAYYSRGRIRFQMGDYSGSIADYSQTIKLNPQDAGAYANRCVAYRYLSDFSTAIADCSEAIKINPNYADALANRCLALIGIGDKESLPASLADCNQAIALNSSQYDAYYGRGLIRTTLGELNQAIADYTEAITYNPNFAAAYYYRGLARFQLNQQKNAMIDFRKAVELCELPTVDCDIDDIDPKGQLEKLGGN